jgi:hypothetical protein
MENLVKIDIKSVMLSLFMCKRENLPINKYKTTTGGGADSKEVESKQTSPIVPIDNRGPSSPKEQETRASSKHHASHSTSTSSSHKNQPREEAGDASDSECLAPQKIVTQATQINHFFDRVKSHNLIGDQQTFDFLVLYALIYFVYIFKVQNFCVDMIYPFYVVCFCLANKFACDFRHSNKTFAAFAGIQLSQFNQIELFVLRKIRYKLYIDQSLLQIFYADTH